MLFKHPNIFIFLKYQDIDRSASITGLFPGNYYMYIYELNLPWREPLEGLPDPNKNTGFLMNSVRFKQKRL